MKKIIFLNILGFLCGVGWIVFHILAGYASSFGNNGRIVPQLNPLLMYGTLGVSILSVFFSHLDLPKRAMIWAILPEVALILSFLFMMKQGDDSAKEFMSQEKQRHKDLIKSIAHLPRLFVFNDPRSPDHEEKFLTTDVEDRFLIRISLNDYSVEKDIVGEFSGKEAKMFESYYLYYIEQYKDEKGFSPLDYFSLKFDLPQMSLSFDLQSRNVLKKTKAFFLSVKCLGKDKCVYSGQDIVFEINIKNLTGKATKIPIDFLKKNRPSVVLTHLNRKKVKEPTWLHGEDFFSETNVNKELTTIKKDESLSYFWTIQSSDIEKALNERDDILGEVFINFPFDEKENYHGSVGFKLINNK
jgi:hypothetical protein